MVQRTPDDTRRFRRQGLRILVDYSCDGGLHCDYATSISAGGLFIETESALPLESCIKLRFRLTNGEMLHEIEGRVCWCNDNTDTNAAQQAPGFGIAFTNGEGTVLLARELEDLEF
ncbi:MAG: PilZ domain-containing protein [Myxococcales bacterium]|nr:PilZ domain-containing protein [Myxococcales bacterium]